MYINLGIFKIFIIGIFIILAMKKKKSATDGIIAEKAKVSVRLSAATSSGERVFDGRNVDREQ